MTRIAVVGCGGLGVPAAWTLALGGASRLRLIDADVVEWSNLHRQIAYGEQDIGRPKVQVLAHWLRQRFADMDIDVMQQRADAATVDGLLDGCDAVLEGTDDALNKFAVNDWAVAQPRHRFATIAAAIGRRGQHFTVTAEGACYRCLFEAPPPAELLSTCSVAGVLGPVVGQVGSLAAKSLLCALRGQADPAHSALLRVGTRGLLRTPVQPAPDCLCQQAARRPQRAFV